MILVVMNVGKLFVALTRVVEWICSHRGVGNDFRGRITELKGDTRKITFGLSQQEVHLISV